jgi:hypothetical protein
MAEMMPGKHGGMLRRGGGNIVQQEQAAVKRFLRDGSMQVAQELMVKALAGDLKAIELVLAYGIGKPSEKVEVSGPDGGPMEIVAGLDDHEKRALRDAIRAHLVTVEA